MKIKKISQNSIWKVLFFFSGIITLNVMGSAFYNTYSDKLVACLGLMEIVIIGLTCIKTDKVNSLLKIGIAEFVSPFLVVTIISIFSASIIYEAPFWGDITQSIIAAMNIAFVFVIAYSAVRRFGKNALDILLAAGCVSYATIIYRIIVGERDVTYLEAHGFIETIGLLFIYYCLSSSYSKKQKLMRCLICATILFLGGKRVAFIGIVWSLIIYLLFSKIKERKDRIIKIVMIVYFMTTVGYLFLIKNGYFSLILAQLNLPDNMRLAFWNLFSDSYELSPLYLGRGILYTDNIMNLPSTANALGFSRGVGIHNDFLRTYIGWGCLPFLYYYYNFFVLNLKKIKRNFINADIWLYFSIASYCFVNYMVDYMLTYIPFNMYLFMIGLLINKESKDKI